MVDESAEQLSRRSEQTDPPELLNVIGIAILGYLQQDRVPDGHGQGSNPTYAERPVNGNDQATRVTPEPLPSGPISFLAGSTVAGICVSERTRATSRRALLAPIPSRLRSVSAEIGR